MVGGFSKFRHRTSLSAVIRQTLPIERLPTNEADTYTPHHLEPRLWWVDILMLMCNNHGRKMVAAELTATYYASYEGRLLQEAKNSTHSLLFFFGPPLPSQ